MTTLTSNQTTAVPMNGTLKIALFYAQMGWAIFPVTAGDKHPHAFARNGVKDATTDPIIINMWFCDNPNLNIGVACGEVSNLTVIDIDIGINKDGTEKAGQAFFDTYEYEFGDTPKANTGGGGVHIFYQYDARIKNKAPIHKNVDVQSDGSYVVVDPSIHPNGTPYHWQNDYDPFETPVATAPDWLVIMAVEVQPITQNTFMFDAAQVDAVLSYDVVQDIRGALSYINADDYMEWVRVGMALKETGAGQQAFSMWDEWSKRSTKYNSSVMIKKWDDRL